MNVDDVDCLYRLKEELPQHLVEEGGHELGELAELLHDVKPVHILECLLDLQ